MAQANPGFFTLMGQATIEASGSESSSHNEGVTIERVVKLGFFMTNNETEYEALIFGLQLAKETRINKL